MQYTDKELEGILSNYKYLLKAIEDNEANILYPYVMSDTNIGGGRSGRISKPTESTAMALIDANYEDIETHVKAVQATYSRMPVDQKRMMEVYYFERSYGMKDKDIASRLNTDRSNLWRWRKTICKELRKQLNR